MGIGDTLGKGDSFARTPRSRRSERGRAKAMAEQRIPHYEIILLQLDDVAATPLNPRRNFGNEEQLTRFGEDLRANGQIAPCVVVTRHAYLALWPEHAEQLPESAQHILVSGERRLRAARHVGLEVLDFVIRDDFATTRETFINHLLLENLSREDFDVIERARGVAALVHVCTEQYGSHGARSRAAEQLGHTRSWVTNQMTLLELPEELQSRLSNGTLPERDGRTIARHAKKHPELDVEALLAHLEETKRAEREKKTEHSVNPPSPDAPHSADDRPTIPSPSEPADTELQAHAPEPDLTTVLSADNTQTPHRVQEEAVSQQDVDPVAQLNAFRRMAVQFANQMQGLEDTYRAAAKADSEAAAKYLAEIQERMDRVVRYLPRQSQEAR